MRVLTLRRLRAQAYTLTALIDNKSSAMEGLALLINGTEAKRRRQQALPVPGILLNFVVIYHIVTVLFNFKNSEIYVAIAS